jgi:hypothetical protein
MSETHTFVEADKKWQFTVKSEFLKQCATPTEYQTYDLMTKFKLNQYLHNPSGPALRRFKDNYMQYWIDGKLLSKEEGERIEHNYNFNNKLLSEIGE